ncbi:MAG: DsbA family protein [Pseudomonadota bacterium]
MVFNEVREEVFAKLAQWQALPDVDSGQSLDVYLDLKSPHAYLAVLPSIEVALDFHVAVNFLPDNLSYKRLGVTKTVGPQMKREPADPSADRKARMYYAAAREYAVLQSLPLKSPYRLLDSNLAHRAFLFAKQFNKEVQFAMQVYLQGWGSGWRDFELESSKDLRAATMAVGVNTEGFEVFLADEGPGSILLAETIMQAEERGLVGTPHFVFFDQKKQREIGLFGREHLALIRGKYFDAGLARNAKVTAEFSHAWVRPLD